ncbi:MAG TPA: transglycosylase SLT domain-containing protein [Casimicrobiaceae bacterium]|nr:transglycosylase SLT domain-containing protein [Casimicrobiaceae bacterium]
MRSTLDRISTNARSAGRACAALALGLALVASHAFAQTDTDFLAAKIAFERGDRKALDALVPALAGHPLERYARYWQLRSRLDELAPDAVQAFLARYPDGPLADRLRVEWLKVLGKRGDFATFAAYYPPAAGEDTELACYAIQARLSRDGAAALAAAKPLWFTGASTPEACNGLFAALVARGDLSVGDRKARVRLAVANGNVRLAMQIAADLPGGDRIAEKAFAAIERDPLRALRNGHFEWKTWQGRELALFALERAARKDAGDARDAWVKWRARLPQADRDYGNVRVAWHGARQLDPNANRWFADVATVTLTAEQRAWRIRAALRVGAWPDVERAIDALPDAERQDPSWRYWRARALAAQDRNDEARRIYESIADRLDFYGLLATEALGRTPAFAPLSTAVATVASIAPPASAPPASPASAPPASPDETAIAIFAARDDVKRAVLLARLDLRLEALREWSYAIRGLDDDALLLAAEYARRAGLYDRAIFTAERTASRVDVAMRYLAPYRPQFTAAAREQGLDLELLYGIARQESRFVADIVSSAGAVGLMQLMPATARWVAKKLAISDYSLARVSEVDLNTQLGAFYFKHWLDRLGRVPALAAAAYNAGPSRAQAWRPSAAPLEGAIWVETIPFNETRDYVKRVLANATLYSHTLERPYVPLSQRLGVVPPRGVDPIDASDP